LQFIGVDVALEKLFKSKSGLSLSNGAFVAGVYFSLFFTKGGPTSILQNGTLLS